MTRLRIARVRVAWQLFFLALFLFLAFTTTFARLGGYPSALLLELDPLNGVTTVLSTGSLYRGLWWSVLVLVATLLLGRVFCGWVCPFGTLHHVVGWLARVAASARAIEKNRYRRSQAFKYYLLVGGLAAAIAGGVQTGLLDPIPLLSRSFTAAVWPVVERTGGGISVQPPLVRLGWIIAGVFVALLALNVVRPRLFCRVLCPLGALLGVLSRLSLWRIARDPARCNDCELCLRRCDPAADPHTFVRTAECHVCFNCLDDCPNHALAFRFLPERGGEVTSPDWTRRRALVSAVAGFVLVPLSRASAETPDRPDPSVIRPPGSLAEPDFLARCVKCDQCVRVCPTGALQPALFEAGLEGIWTPRLVMRTGYCELNCVLCGHVCPTGAIERVSVERKLGLGAAAGEPIRIGTAFFDQGRCLPWAMDIACVVCQEVCPTSPKSIVTRDVDVIGRNGETIRLRRPQVDPALCTGCGICEHECPVADRAAIRVTSVGETRSRSSALLL